MPKMNYEFLHNRGVGNLPDTERFGTNKPQEITDDASFARQAQATVQNAISKTTNRPLNQKPKEGGR